jgi:hypothetical protein
MAAAPSAFRLSASSWQSSYPRGWTLGRKLPGACCRSIASPSLSTRSTLDSSSAILHPVVVRRVAKFSTGRRPKNASTHD